jgi:hypothetical protein
LSTRGTMPSKLTSCKLSRPTTRTTTSRTKPSTCTSTKPKVLLVQTCTGLTGVAHWSNRCSSDNNTSCSLSLSSSRNCPRTRLGPGHLHTRLKYTIGRVVIVLVSPLLRHSLLSLPLEAKLKFVTISPTMITMELHYLRFRLGLGLLNWFLSTRLLSRFLPTRLPTLFPKEHFPRSAHKLDRLLEIICLWGKHGWSWGCV